MSDYITGLGVALQNRKHIELVPARQEKKGAAAEELGINSKELRGLHGRCEVIPSAQARTSCLLRRSATSAGHPAEQAEEARPDGIPTPD